MFCGCPFSSPQDVVPLCALSPVHGLQHQTIADEPFLVSKYHLLHFFGLVIVIDRQSSHLLSSVTHFFILLRSFKLCAIGSSPAHFLLSLLDCSCILRLVITSLTCSFCSPCHTSTLWHCAHQVFCSSAHLVTRAHSGTVHSKSFAALHDSTPQVNCPKYHVPSPPHSQIQANATIFTTHKPVTGCSLDLLLQDASQTISIIPFNLLQRDIHIAAHFLASYFFCFRLYCFANNITPQLLCPGVVARSEDGCWGSAINTWVFSTTHSPSSSGARSRYFPR